MRKKQEVKPLYGDDGIVQRKHKPINVVITVVCVSLIIILILLGIMSIVSIYI